MVWYRTGTVSVTNGSTTVTLTGGNALTNIFPGDTFWGPDGKPYEIAAISSETTFTLATDYQGPTATGQPYAIQPTGSTGALRLLHQQVSDLVAAYQAGRDAWASTAAGALKGRAAGSGAGVATDLTPVQVLTLLTAGAPAALAGTEKLAALQGSGAVGLTVNQLLSRAAGQVLPVEIGGSRIATITENGVGVGTPTPGYPVHVYGSGREIWVTAHRPDATGVQGAGFLAIAGPNYYSTFKQRANGDAELLNANNGRLLFGTNSQISFDILPSNSVRFGSIESVFSARIYVGQASGQSGVVFRPASDGSTPILFSNASGSQVGSITTTGASTSYNTTSDHRLKTNVADITDEEAIEWLDASRPVWFDWVETGQRVDGYLAHEMQDLISWAVTGEKDEVVDIGRATGYRERDPVTGAPILGTQEIIEDITEAECPEGYVWEKTGERPVYQGIDQSKVVPRLNAACKALLNLIRAQADQIADLEARVAALEAAAA